MKEKPERVHALIYGKALNASLRSLDGLHYPAGTNKSKIDLFLMLLMSLQTRYKEVCLKMQNQAW